MTIPVISDKAVKDIDLSTRETIFTGYNDMLQKMSLKGFWQIELKGQNEVIPLNYLGLKKDFVISGYFTNGGLPIAIVDETVFERLKNDVNPEIQKESSLYIGIDIKDEANLEKANEIFKEMNFSDNSLHYSRLEMSNSRKKIWGLSCLSLAF